MPLSPHAEPRRYWFYDRFLSRLTGIVHKNGLPTNHKYVLESQLMDQSIKTDIQVVQKHKKGIKSELIVPEQGKLTVARRMQQASSKRREPPTKVTKREVK